MPDAYSLYIASEPGQSGSHSGLALSGNLVSVWAGHMGDGLPGTSNTVKVETGMKVRFTYDIYTQDYYSGQWVFSSHAPTYAEVNLGLNPFNMTGIAANTDFSQTATVDISCDFDQWFHQAVPDDNTYHYHLVSVTYEFSQSAVIYWEGPVEPEKQDPPGRVWAADAGWYNIP